MSIINSATENREAKIFFELIRQGWGWTDFYVEKLENTDVYRRIEAEEYKLNCAVWIVGHMTWASNSLLLKATGGEARNTEWLREFRYGSSGNPGKSWPVWKVLLEEKNKIREIVSAFFSSFADSKLDEKPLISWEGNIRSVIVHAIRHEVFHCGQLAWLCRMNGITLF